MNLYLNEVSGADDALLAVIPTAQSGRITLCDMRDGVDQVTGNALKGLFVPRVMGGYGSENKEAYDVFNTEQFPRFKNTAKGLEAALLSAIAKSKDTGRNLDTKCFYFSPEFAKSQDYAKEVKPEVVEAMMKKWDMSTLKINTHKKYGTSLRVWLPGEQPGEVTTKTVNDLTSEGWFKSKS